MGDRKTDEKFPVQILNLFEVKVDFKIQSRVQMSKEDERDFAEAMLRGDRFPPITVYFDGKVYWLADGFHRHGAAKQAMRADPKLKGIRAEVRRGTRRDAIVFSAGANKKFSIKRTREDMKKAIWMLLDDEEWRTKSRRVLGDHVGVNSASAARFYNEYFVERGLAIPDVVQDMRGAYCPAKVPRKKAVRKRGLHKCGYVGVSLDPVKAGEKLAEMFSPDQFRILAEAYWATVCEAPSAKGA